MLNCWLQVDGFSLQERRRITEEEFRSPRHESQSSESSGTQARNARNSSSSHESVGGLPPQVDTQAEAQQETVEDQAARLQQRQQAEMLETEARLHEELHMNDVRNEIEFFQSSASYNSVAVWISVNFITHTMDWYYIMAGCVIVVAKEVFYHSNCDDFTLQECLNDEKLLHVFASKFKYVDIHLYIVNNF